MTVLCSPPVIEYIFLQSNIPFGFVKALLKISPFAVTIPVYDFFNAINSNIKHKNPIVSIKSLQKVSAQIDYHHVCSLICNEIAEL